MTNAPCSDLWAGEHTAEALAARLRHQEERVGAAQRCRQEGQHVGQTNLQQSPGNSRNNEGGKLRLELQNSV